jgi:hypothetical protein
MRRKVERRRQGTKVGERVWEKSGRLEEDGSMGGYSDFTGPLGERWCFGWKFGFIEDNIAGKVDFVRVRIKTPVATLVGTIADKYARLTSEG